MKPIANFLSIIWAAAKNLMAHQITKHISTPINCSSIATVLLITCCFFQSKPIQAQCSAVNIVDSLQLVSFYNATDGDNWEFNMGWLTAPVSEWFGILLTPDGCHVESISLVNKNLQGTLINFNLPYLTNLDLAYNHIGGELPDFSNLPKLAWCGLAHNQLEGTLPDFTNNPDLIGLYLSENLLTGAIPNFSNLPNLIHLYLYSNLLTGEIPDFEHLPKLNELLLYDNQLSGSLPDFGHIPELSEMYLYFNNISGTLPNFSNLPNLVAFSVDVCSITGAIPDYDNLPNLQQLNVANNQLSGTLPNFSHLPNLTLLYVDGNQLTGMIPNFTNLPALQNLVVCPNNFFSSAPNFENCPLLDLDITNFSCLETAHLNGYAYHDQNANCQQDADERPIPNALVVVNGGQHYGYTDNNGFYDITVDVNTYTIQCLPPNYMWNNACIEQYEVTTTSYSDTLSQNFAFVSNEICPLLTVQASTPILRRCSNNIYTIYYCNEGTQDIDDVAINITLPTVLELIETSIPYEQNDNVLIFDVGDLALSTCGSFTLTVKPLCDAEIGSAACLEASIAPIPPCLEEDLAGGYHLLLTGECTGNEIRFRVLNLGDDMPTGTPYRVYEDDILSALGTLQLIAGQHQDFNYLANGSTRRMRVDANNDLTFVSDPQVFVEACGSGTSSLGFGNTTAQPDNEPYIDIDCETILSAFDPNDKIARPQGVGAAHYILPTDDIAYMLRFQNVGNDTAFTVVVIDTIDVSKLDITTLRIENASHPYRLEIADNNILRFYFAPILLPDSTTDETRSHGFIKFNIQPKAAIAESTVIENQAHIFFDYNQPVSTNTTFHTICYNAETLCMPTNISPTPTTDFDAYMYWNNEQLTVVNYTDSICQFRLYDICSKQVWSQSIEQGTTSIKMPSLPNAIYMCQLNLDKKQKVLKIIVM